MADRLSLKQKRAVASLMQIFGSPTKVRREFAERFSDRDLPSRLAIYGQNTSCHINYSPRNVCQGNKLAVKRWFLCVEHVGKQVETVQ